MIKWVAAALTVFMVVSNAAGEVPSFHITPKQTTYEDIQFQVLVEEEKLMHDQWNGCIILVCVSAGDRKTFSEKA